MMRIRCLFLLMSIAGYCSGQDSARVLTNRKGVPILPQQGDWALGLSTTPFFQYLGNIFNNSTYNQAPTFSTSGPGIVAKYMKNATTAYRINALLTASSQEGKQTVHDVTSTDPAATVIDRKNYSYNNFQVGAGLEKRRGKGRLQAIYGAGVFVGFSSSNSTYSYGNKFSPTNSTVPFTIWDANSAIPNYVTAGSERTVNSKTGTSIYAGLSVFLGAEYFIAPKISIGGEFGYRLFKSNSPLGSTTTELFDPNANALTTSTHDVSGTAYTFSLTTFTSGNINLIVYF